MFYTLQKLHHCYEQNFPDASETHTKCVPAGLSNTLHPEIFCVGVYNKYILTHIYICMY